MGSVRTPTGLDKRGRALWRSIAPKYDLRPDELRTLEDACKLADLIERMETKLEEDDELVVPGSMKQPTAHPMITELRQYRSSLSKMLGSLKLPDADDGEKKSASESARAAAHARWSKKKTA